MTSTALLLFMAGVLDSRPAPVFADVTIGARGPYRFLVDTGSQTSLIDQQLAARLGLTPEFRVELITQHSKRLLPAMTARELQIGSTRLKPVELVLDDLSAARQRFGNLQGLLGINALAGLDFALSPGAGLFEIAPARPAGETVPFTRVEDRIAVRARMGRETLTLILDSGSSHVVLFRRPAAMANTKPVVTSLNTIEGARTTVPTSWTADLFFNGRLRIGMQPAAIVEREGAQAEGLLPANLFKQIYVDQARQQVVLVR